MTKFAACMAVLCAALAHAQYRTDNFKLTGTLMGLTIQSQGDCRCTVNVEPVELENRSRGYLFTLRGDEYLSTGHSSYLIVGVAPATAVTQGSDGIYVDIDIPGMLYVLQASARYYDPSLGEVTFTPTTAPVRGTVKPSTYMDQFRTTEQSTGTVSSETKYGNLTMSTVFHGNRTSQTAVFTGLLVHTNVVPLLTTGTMSLSRGNLTVSTSQR